MSSGSEILNLTPEAERERDLRELSKGLARYHFAELRAMAKASGLKPSSTRKADAVDALARHFACPTRIQETLSDLSPLERDLIDLLYLSDEGAQGQFIADIHSILQRLNGGSASIEPLTSSELRAQLQSLAARGLILQRPSGPRQPIWQLPGVIRRYLFRLSERLSPDRLKEVDGLRIEPSRGTALSHAAYAVWLHIRCRKVPKPYLTCRNPAEYSDESLVGWETLPEEVDRFLAERQRGWQLASNLPLTVLAPPMPLPEESLRELSRKTGFSKSAVDLMVVLLAELELVTTRDRRWVVLGEELSSFLRSSEAQRIRLLAKAWQATEKWSAAMRQQGPGSSLILRRRAGQTHFKLDDLVRQLAKARQFPLRLLSRLETGSWCNFVSFLGSLRRLDPNFLLTPQVGGTPNGAIWWWEESESGRQLDPADESSWLLIHRAYLSALWAGPLHWMGLVDIAYEDEHIAAFRLTELGGYVLGHRTEPTVGRAKEAALTVGEDLTVNVRADQADAEAHDLLSRAARLVDTNSQDFRYRITRETAHHAFQSGLTLGEMVSILRKRSKDGLPPSAKETLEDWWRSYGTTRAYQDLTLISFADDTALQEMLAATSLEEHLIHVFSPRLVAIEPDSLDVLRSELVKRGYTPKVES